MSREKSVRYKIIEFDGVAEGDGEYMSCGQAGRCGIINAILSAALQSRTMAGKLEF